MPEWSELTLAHWRQTYKWKEMASDPRPCSPKCRTPWTQVRKCLIISFSSAEIATRTQFYRWMMPALKKEGSDGWSHVNREQQEYLFSTSALVLPLLSSEFLRGWATGSQCGRDRKETEMADFGGRRDEGQKTPFISPKAGEKNPRKLDQFESKILQSGKKKISTSDKSFLPRTNSPD